jgi:hypothetical protein
LPTVIKNIHDFEKEEENNYIIGGCGGSVG